MMINGSLFLLLAAGNLFAFNTEFSQTLKSRALQFFLEHSNPSNGLVKDRAVNRKNATPRTADYQMASTAATGFGYAVLTHAAKSGVINPVVVEELIYRSLSFVYSEMPHHKGWLYHFVDWQTGQRYSLSEVSTVDTAWFLGGALYAGQVWGGRVKKVADSLYRRIDFSDMMTDGGKYPNRRTLSMGWLPESGYLRWHWDTYAEHMLLVLLGLGHPTQPLPAEAWSAWARPIGAGVLGGDLPLFIHQYSHLFINFQGKQDAFADYFSNSVKATQEDRKFCANDNSKETYRAGFWGLSASGSATGYKAFSPVFQDGTVCPGCAAASLVFLPEMVMTDLEKWAKGPLKDSLWGDYGFADSVSLDQNWFDPDVIGITVGGVYLALANLDNKLPLWKTFEEIPSVGMSLRRAGFVKR